MDDQMGGGTATSWVAAVPLLCAVHCLAAPLLLVIAPALVHAPEVEAGLIVLGAGVAVPVAVSGARIHRRPVVLAPIAVGIAFWLASMVLPGGWLGETVYTITGSLLVAGALVWNGRLRRRTAGCGPSCSH